MRKPDYNAESDMILPPAFRLVTLREVGDAMDHARSIAARDGAGTLVFVGRFDLAEFAVVLEPEEPLRIARRAFYAGMTGLGDALAAHAPPDKPIEIGWPDALRVDGGLVGGGQLAWPQGADESQPPEWLIFGGMIRTVSMSDTEPGMRPLSSALEEEGFDDVSSGRLVETFARNFMVALDAWQEHGFGAVAREYLKRLPAQSGVRRDIEENGDLLVRRTASAQADRQELRAALLRPSWFDPNTRGPKS